MKAMIELIDALANEKSEMSDIGKSDFLVEITRS